MTIDMPARDALRLPSDVAVAERQDAPAARSGVPWRTIVPIAVVLAYADGFWMTAIRGAVGAIERTQARFAGWVHDSTLMLPLFVLAVTVALALARRRMGPQLRSPRAVALTGVFVAVAATLAGTAAMAASAAYDYRLQVEQLAFMDSLHGSCSTGVCLAQQEQATFAVAQRSVGYGALILLATNLVLVAWVVAARGGRLDVVGRRSARVDELLGRGRAGDLRAVLSAALVGSAVIHALVVPEHLDEWPAAGVFFTALVVAELVLAVLVITWRHRTVLLAAAASSAGPLVVWAYSRYVGLPFGPDPGATEPVGLPDLAACGVELLALVLAVVLLLRGARLRQQPAVQAYARAIAVLAVVVVTAFGLAGIGLPTSGAGVGQATSHAHGGA